MNNLKISVTIIFLSFLFPTFIFAQSKYCSQEGYTILIINGMRTDELKASINQSELERRVGFNYNNQKLVTKYLHNPSHLAGFGEVFDVINQKLLEDKITLDYDMTEMLRDISDKVNTQKVLFVGHSQGNFYTNDFYDLLGDRSGGIPKQSIGVYGVATPASYVAGKGKYITSHSDAVINELRQGVLDVLPANATINLPVGNTSNGHSFSDVYLEHQGPRIVREINSALSELEENNIQDENLPCVAPFEIDLTHKVIEGIYTVADPLANATKTAMQNTYAVGVAIRDAASRGGDRLYAFSRYITDTVGNLGRNNATALLGNTETEESTNENTEENSGQENRATPPRSQPVSIQNQEPGIIRNTEIETVRPSTRPLFRGGGGNETEVVSEEELESEEPIEPAPDTEAPEIIILGESSVTIPLDSIYIDAGARVEDVVDGEIIPIVAGEVNTLVPGLYEISYTATDLSGNANTRNRYVRVDSGAALSRPTSIFIQDDYAYVTSYDDHALEIVNISNPARPTHVSYLIRDGTNAWLNHPEAIYVENNYAYVISQNALEIIDIENIINPVVVSKVTNQELALTVNGGALLCPVAITAADQYLYIASTACRNANFGRTDIIDISNPENPFHVAQISAFNTAQGNNAPVSVFTDEDYLYQTYIQGDAIEIIDISDPSSPVKLAQINGGFGGALLNTPSSVFVKDHYAYVASTGSNALEIFNMSDPAQPLFVSRFEHGTDGAELNAPVRVYVEDEHAYVISSEGNSLEIIDISDPLNPRHVGLIIDGMDEVELSNPRSIFVKEGFAYITSTSSNAVQIIDVSEPSNPHNAGKISDGEF